MICIELIIGYSRAAMARSRSIQAILTQKLYGQAPREAAPQRRQDMSRMQTQHGDLATNGAPKTRMPIHVDKKIGRNDPCPCGSGLKYKNCHGKGLV